jgi:periplasmic protein CpxP/Spy
MTSKQIKAAAIIVGLLVVLNIALIATIWLQRDRNKMPPPPGQSDAQQILVKELSLNDRQVRSFDSLRTVHFRQIGELKQQMRQLKDGFFSGIGKPASSPDSIAGAIGQVQTKIELSTYHHFAAVRNLCDPAQQQKFDRIINDVLRSLKPGGPEGPPRRPGH